MAKLVDLLPISANNSSDMGAGWLVNFSYLLGMDLRKAKEVYEKYGKGYIYSPTGFAMPDTPQQRYKMTSVFGSCVVVESDGKTWVRTSKQIGACNRKRAKISKIVERREERKALQEWRTEKRTRRIFEDGKTTPPPKRGGKANNRSDIGKYVNFHGTRMYETESKGEVRFAKITVHV